MAELGQEVSDQQVWRHFRWSVETRSLRYFRSSTFDRKGFTSLSRGSDTCCPRGSLLSGTRASGGRYVAAQTGSRARPCHFLLPSPPAMTSPVLVTCRRRLTSVPPRPPPAPLPPPLLAAPAALALVPVLARPVALRSLGRLVPGPPGWPTRFLWSSSCGLTSSISSRIAGWVGQVTDEISIRSIVLSLQISRVARSRFLLRDFCSVFSGCRALLFPVSNLETNHLQDQSRSQPVPEVRHSPPVFTVQSPDTLNILLCVCVCVSVDLLGARSACQSVARPLARSACQSATRPVDRSVAQPVARLVDLSVGRPVRMVRLVNRSVARLVGRLLGPSVGRSVGRPVAQLLGLSLDRPVGHSTCRSIAWPVARSLGLSLGWSAFCSVARPVARLHGLSLGTSDSYIHPTTPQLCMFSQLICSPVLSRYRHHVELVRFLNQFADPQKELPPYWDKKVDDNGRVSNRTTQNSEEITINNNNNNNNEFICTLLYKICHIWVQSSKNNQLGTGCPE